LVKRAGDTVVAVVGLVVLAVPLAVVAVVIKATSPGPVLFRARRVGRGGALFTCWKFRTMVVHAPLAPWLPDHGSYLTPVGGFLRRCSIDELPQLANILIGEMSLVGPRPVSPAETLTLEGRAACGADRWRPGLTGLAQINGRDANTEEQRLRWDAEWVRRWSLRLDLAIIVRTFKWVFLGDVSKPSKTAVSPKDRDGEAAPTPGAVEGEP
jgi:O-antigen biosynthesis protein WbqP